MPIPTLTKTQYEVLAAAEKREDGSVILPPRLRGGPADKLIAALERGSLIARADAHDVASTQTADIAGSTPFRITWAGRGAVGAFERRQSGSVEDGEHLEGEAIDVSGVQPNPPPAEDASSLCVKAPRQGSKEATVLGLITRPEGASIHDLTRATGWLPHTARAVLTGLRKRGYVIVLEKAEGGQPALYRLA